MGFFEDFVSRFSVDADDAVKGLDDYEKASDSAKASTVALGNVIADGVTALAGLGLQAAQTAVNFTKDLVFGFAEAADETAKTAKTFGFATDELQRLQFAAQAVGAPIDKVTDGAKDLKLRLGEAARTGAGPIIDAMGELGLRMEHFEGLTFEEKFGLIGERLSEVSDEARKSALSIQFFGESGIFLGNLLDEGADGIKALGDRAEDLGAVLSGDTLKAAEDFQGSLQEVRATVASLTTTISAKLLPVAEKWLKKLEAFLEQNRELVASRVQAFFDGLIRVIERGIPIVLKIFEHWDKFAALLASASLIRAFSNVSDGLKAMGVAANLSLGPIGLISAALVALIPLAIEAGEALGDAISKGNELRASQEERALGKIGIQSSALGARIAAQQAIIAREEKIIEEETGIFGGLSFRGGEARRRRDKANRELVEAQRENKKLADEMGERRKKLAKESSRAVNEGIETGDLLVRLADEITQGGKKQLSGARKKKFNKAADILEKGGSIEEARRAAGLIGGSQGGSGGAKQEKSEDEQLLELVQGVFANGPASEDDLVKSIEGRGAAAALGGVFVSNDNRVIQNTEVKLSLPASAFKNLDDPGRAEKVAEALSGAMNDQLRQAADHFQRSVRF